MAVDSIKPRDYYQHYYATVAAQFLLTQLVILAISSGACWLIWQYSELTQTLTFISGMMIFALLELVAMPLLVKTLTDPTRVLTQALAHITKGNEDIPAPNINKLSYERSGLKSVVQTIYELKLSDTTSAIVPGADSQNPSPALSPQALAELTAALPCGVIALHADHTVAFYNPQAPVHLGPGNRPALELLFEETDSLQRWLTECETNKVRDTKLWRRVPNRLPDTDDLRIFDVIGYYNKGNKQGIEAILVTIDRTPDYVPDQEDMDFIALAAHELRGPITVIRGYLDVLSQELKPTLQNDQKELIDRLNVSANRLSGYVNNILNVSRYDRKHLKLHLHEDNLVDILRGLVDDLEMRARTQNRLLGFTVPDDLPTIAADRNSLSEVISNLVDNAIKYSHEGGQIIVGASVKGNFVELTVQDFGIGVPASVVGNLFNKFYRSHRSRQSVGGTGLGLYISKAIIESHGGGIWVRSTEGQGTTFGFTIPIYATVADKLKSSNNGNEGIIENANGWIRNHAMYRR